VRCAAGNTQAPANDEAPPPPPQACAPHHAQRLLQLRLRLLGAAQLDLRRLKHALSGGDLCLCQQLVGTQARVGGRCRVLLRRRRHRVLRCRAVVRGRTAGGVRAPP
jgi:hypothetical protein